MSKKILLVEDDNKFRDALMLIFEDRDYTFLEASSVQEGLRLIKENPDVQVVLLDLNLPGGTGTDFLEGLKGETSKYRVIILTAYEELLAAEKAKSYEVFSYAAKAGTSLRESLRFHVERAFEDLERAWLRKKIDAHQEIERKITLIGLNAGGNTDLELGEVLDAICEYALDLIDAYTCHIRVFDPGRDDFVLWTSRGRNGQPHGVFQERVRHNEPYSGIVAESKLPLVVDDLQNDPLFRVMMEAVLEGDSDPHHLDYMKSARSAYVVPISTGIFGNDIDAVFNINSDEQSFFATEVRRELVHDFVTQTTLAITKHLLRKKRIEIHADYKNISEMLEEVSNVLKGEYDLNEIFKIVLTHLSDGLKPEIISIFLFNESSQRLENVAEFRADRWEGKVKEEYSSGEGMVGRIFSMKQTERFIPALRHLDVFVAQAIKQEKIANIPSGELRHYLGVPIKIGDAVIGVIRAVNKRSEYYNHEAEKTNSICLLKRGFSDDCQLELEMAASHLAVTIKNAELFGKVNKKMSRLKAIENVGKRIGSERDAAALQQLIVTEAAKFMGAEICMLLLTNKRGDKLFLSQSYGMPLMEDMTYGMDEGKTGKVAMTGSPILEKHGSKDYQGKYDERIVKFLRDKHQDETAGVESFMAVPIIGEGKILGVIKVINKLESPYYFDEDDLGLFQMFASQIALERFLYTSYSYQKNIVDNSPDPIIFLDKYGEVEVFNKACEQLWGYSSEEVINRSVVNLYVSEAQARKIGKELWESRGHRIKNVEEEIKHKNGDIIPVSLSAAFLFDQRGDRTGSMGVFKDLREIKQLQDQMLRADRESVVGRLAKTIGHEIKHEIGAVLLYIVPLLRECDREKQSELYQIYTDIHESMQVARDNLNKLFEAVQPTPPQKEIVRIGDIFNENMVNSMRRQANGKNVDFVLKCPDIEHKLSVDIKQIADVLWNLFDNSLDAIDKNSADGLLLEKGRIEASVYVKDRFLELTWKDNGCGIPKENDQNIFQPLWTNKEKGTGLGLSILKNNVEGHGGAVSVSSTEGKGTTFHVSIPASMNRQTRGGSNLTEGQQRAD